ncbi:kelch-like protein 12 [Stylophora pistillata]|uniref:kelch-like protein 12 n=1 Tax=Stylophora pistillata TaxID=50429 RepID=UPI000C03E462|nr:kelch-like protein 12 [Stylophora pistillata]
MLSNLEKDMEGELTNDQLDFSQPWHLSDVVLKVEEERFHVHRSILAMWSPDFSKMFTSEFSEKTADEVLLPGKNVSEIREMLLVIYPTSAKEIDDKNYSFLLNLAREYMMKKLTEKCEGFLMDELSYPRYNSYQCLDLLVTAQSYNLERLQEECIIKARELNCRDLKECQETVDKISSPNYQKVVDGIMQRMQVEIQSLRSKNCQARGVLESIERSASRASEEFEEIMSLLVQVARDSPRDHYRRIRLNNFDDKINVICSHSKAGFMYFQGPLRELKSSLESISRSVTSQEKV